MQLPGGAPWSRADQGCLDGTVAVPPPRLGLCSFRLPSAPEPSPYAQKQLVVTGTLGLDPAPPQSRLTVPCTPCLSLDPFRPAPGSPLGCFCPSQGLPPAHANIWSIVYTASHPRCFAKAQPGPEMRGPVRNTALLETCKTAQTSLE